ncbi:MAG: glycosyltransferase family 4 protein [Chthoniobacterales bacterium]|nr:glycosyltransferase family 4 protein [Chthoniobacterales bacterium]
MNQDTLTGGGTGFDLGSFAKGVLLYLLYRKKICFDESEYRKIHLQRDLGIFTGIWFRFPKLHFLAHFSDDPEMQVAVLGQELRVLVDDEEFRGRFDAGKPTVVFVSYDVARAGASKVVLEILKDYAKTHNTVFFSLAGGDRKATFTDCASYCVFELGTRGCQKQLQRQLERVGRVVRPELAIVNSIGAAEALVPLAGAGIPRMQLIHEIADIEDLRRFETVARFADATVFPANFVRDRALNVCAGLDASKCQVLPQGVFEEKDDPEDGGTEGVRSGLLPASWDDGSIVVLGVGGVNFRKGVDLFLMCAGLVGGKFPGEKVRFLWVGFGYESISTEFPAYLRHQLRVTQLADVVHFTGELRDLPAAYACADIFFLPSRLDPLPLVAQQAMDCGLPVVCFDEAGGIPEFLRADPVAAGGVVGYLDVPAAAGKIMAFAADPELRNLVGEAGRRVARSAFDTETYIESIRSLGRRLCVGGVRRTAEPPPPGR